MDPKSGLYNFREERNPFSSNEAYPVLLQNFKILDICSLCSGKNPYLHSIMPHHECEHMQQLYRHYLFPNSEPSLKPFETSHLEATISLVASLMILSSHLILFSPSTFTVPQASSYLHQWTPQYATQNFELLQQINLAVLLLAPISKMIHLFEKMSQQNLSHQRRVTSAA